MCIKCIILDSMLLIILNKVIMLVIDDFLSQDAYNTLKNHSLTCSFEGVVNPIDGVFYPDINTDIPNHVREGVLRCLEEALKVKVSYPIIFLRMSLEGTHCPNIFHTDNSHGTHSLMLYLNDRGDAGTALVKHIGTGLVSAPTIDEDLQELIKDSNDLSKWTILGKSCMRQNSACIFEAARLHCALPIGGFGSTQEDARVVLTVFFTIDEQI